MIFTQRRPHDTIAGVKAVLWDMDGTLVDSEKLWDVSLAALYAKLGGELTPAVRASIVGSLPRTPCGSSTPTWASTSIPRRCRTPPTGCNDYTEELFDGGLPWCDGAKELLEALAAEGTPMALVTNTHRALTDKALNSIGRHYFSATVCGDEVPTGKPAPDPYLRAAALAGPGTGAVPGRRGLGDRNRGGRARRMPGVGGAQRRRGAGRQAATARFFAGRSRRRRSARHLCSTDYAVPRTHRLTSGL